MPEIRTDNQLVTQITVVEPEPDKQVEALSVMKDRARFMARQPGFVSIVLHRSLDGKRIVNYVQGRAASCCKRRIDRRNSARSGASSSGWPRTSTRISTKWRTSRTPAGSRDAHQARAGNSDSSWPGLCRLSMRSMKRIRVGNLLIAWRGGAVVGDNLLAPVPVTQTREGVRR